MTDTGTRGHGDAGTHFNGFTLLEVMVAVAILGMVLVTLIGLQNRGMQDVMLADHITTATLLAKREMTDMLLKSSGTPTTDSETEGEFPEEEFESYTWKKTVVTIMPLENVLITEMRVAVLWKEGDQQEMVELKSYK